MVSVVKDRVRDFIIRVSRLRSIEDDADILESGLLNSLLLAEILSFVEQQFGVEIADEDLESDNFRSISAISRFVERKQSQAVLT